MMIVKDEAKRRALARDIEDKAGDLDELLKLVSESLKELPKDKKQFEEMEALLADYRKTRDQQVSLIESGKIKEAQTLAATVQDERYNRIRDMARILGNNALSRAKARINAAQTRAGNLSRTLTIIGFAVFALSLGAVFLLNNIIAKPLVTLTGAAEKIAGGDLAVGIDSSHRRDEAGTLTRAFFAMVEYLRNMAALSEQVADGNLRVTVTPASDRDALGNAYVKMVENLRGIHREIQNSVGVLASSAGEILASSSQIASGMVETATSVSETTATVEEVRQTAQLATEKSRSVSENARNAAIVAEQGNAAVAKTMAGINHIKEQMQSVAESVVMLSEQTQAIGEIITAVNDLAQQSNLLAVNAAIEASKAGAHGKGFAVVAQEIKSLADQSKQATEQVRVILADIQKATGRSVLAAEQVSKAVDSSVRQAAESGDSIRMLAENIYEAAQAAAQIAASSQQQLAGMEQVAMAMESIKQASQQNVSGTKQAELAAHTLNDLGKNLNELIGTYKV